MLEANELRIGNWVRFNGQPYPVNGLFISDLEKKKLAKPAAPIPLTPEVLEACGFAKRPRDDDFDYWFHPKIGEEIWEHDKGFCHSFCFGGDIQCLHQLQNLYYALTGEELQYQP